VAQDAGEVREAIARDRAELAGTVQALAQKTDVKARAREAVAHNTEQVQRTLHDVSSRARAMTPAQAREWSASAAGKAKERPLPVAIAVAFVLGVVIGRFARRR